MIWRKFEIRWTRCSVVRLSSLIACVLLVLLFCQYLISSDTTDLSVNQLIWHIRNTQSGNIEDGSERGKSNPNYSRWRFNINTLDDEPINVTADILEVVRDQRKLIREELDTLSFYGSKGHAFKKNYKKLTLENGGQPWRNIIVTTWRSGSTFLADIFNSIPGTFYHYEPLLDYNITQIRGPPFADSAIDRLQHLFHCDYQKLADYLKYGEEHTYLFYHNTRLWERCKEKPHLCWLPQFLTPFCKLFPFQTMKVVRLRLSLFETLLQDPDLNLKILYLVRDPRGTLQSRKHRDWCPSSEDCSDPVRLCSDLISDYSASLRFYKRFPSKFRTIRYEDLAVNLPEKVEELLNFFGFSMHENVVQYLQTHTKSNYGGVSSTYRDSKSAPFHWRNDLQFAEVDYIQTTCKSALKLWHYRFAANESHQKIFNPLDDDEVTFY